MKQINILIIMAAMASSAAWSQNDATVIYNKKIHDESLAHVMPDRKFVLMGPPVKGAPYTAEGITEETQTLGDGTHINRQETFTIYRDGEGRIRRESGGEVWISDPVAETSYVFDTKQQTARKMPLNKTFAFMKMQGAKVRDEAAAGRVSTGGPVLTIDSAGLGNVVVRNIDQPENTESLGRQEMEGVEVEGTRNTSVIPQGQIGNDRALQIVHERWESAELHVTILAKHTDPMKGDRVERLTNVRRGEPDPALFQVPAGYQIESEK